MKETQDELIETYEEDMKVRPTDAVVDDILWRIKKISADVDKIQRRRNDAREFYDKKEIVLNERIDRLSQIVEDYVRNSDRKTVDTPNGTARLRSVSKIRWDKVMEEELISFSLKNDIEISKRPQKTAIVNYIKNTGDAPEWFEEYTEKSFSYQIKVDKDG